MAIGSPEWMYKSEDYTVDQSLKYEGGRTTYLSKTPTSSGNRKTSTFSTWVKISPAAKSGGQDVLFEAYEDNANRWSIFIGDNSANYISVFGETGDSTDVSLHTDTASGQAFRDYSAWYHIMFVLDTTQSTASNRAKIYINGVEANYASTTYPSQNSDLILNKNVVHHLGAGSWSGSVGDYYFSGNMAETYFIDGQALTPADFGETGDYGEWKPKEYSGTYGTNGFYLPFKNDYTVEGFSTVTYKGNGNYGHYIGGTGFKPDLTWIKERNGTSDHCVVDSVRGATKKLQTNTTDAEDNDTNSVTAFTTDGFTVGAQNQVNENGMPIVAWNWDMGADTPTGFGAVAYKGNGGTQSVSGFGFRPDVTWIKARHTTYDHYFEDRIRGTGKILYWNKTDTEDNISHAITSFDPDGFSMGSESGHNENNGTYISYGWDMGGTSATNTTGSINATVMANPTYGQSVISFDGNNTAGATVGHGLSSAPEVVLVMNRERIHNPTMFHTSIGNTKYLHLDGTAAEDTNTTYWNSTSPTSSVFSLGTSNDVNANGENHMALCFHSVSGYSKFGSYTGNGSSNGTTVTLGFRPAMVIIKPSSSADHWNMYDSTRDPLNPTDSLLFPNRTNAEATGQEIEITDTGFQLKTDNAGSNGNGETYIYMAFAGGMDSISDYNTDGSIDSRVKANPTYGQSIVKYTGNTASSATVGHGLNSAPEFMIVRTTAANAWAVYHTSIGNTHLLEINTTAGKADNNEFWNDTSPTNSVFTIGSHNEVNHTQDYIAYCFHSVTGYSKFGSYSGTGNASGNSVTLGFEPAFVMVKASSGSYSWAMFDNTRAPDSALFANVSNAEESLDYMDFTSTGFNLTTTHPNANGSGQTYIYMAFADKREYAYWLDQSGNNNDWTSNNLTESDISVDSPTNNFATYNPLYEPLGTYTEGNLKWIGPGAWAWTPSTIALPTTGKWYFETMLINNGRNANDTYGSMGVMRSQTERQSDNWSRIRNDGCLMTDGYLGYNFSTTDSFSGSENKYAKDILSCAIDRDNNTFNFRLNNVSIWNGTLASSTTESLNFVVVSHSSSYGGSMIANFGQDSSFAGNKPPQGKQDGNDIGDFFYEPPSGYLTLCTDNLPDVAVVPSEHFDVVTYTGTGSNQAVAVNFQPDLTWIKVRSVVDGSVVADSVRGATKFLSTTYTQAESTNSAFVSAFTSTGLTLGGNRGTSELGKTYVAWNWKANGSGSSNTNGSINSTVSANVDSGFSIVSYTGNGSAGATVGHGLSKAPEMVIIKHREHTGQWQIYHHSVRAPNAEDYFLMLNATDAAATDGSASRWNNTDPSSTVVTLGTDWEVNDNTKDYIMYCFHSVDGYCKVGAYKGNSSTDGTFVYTGFAPSYILVKSFDETRNWHIMDSTRNPNNVANHVLYSNRNNAEYSDNAYTDVDFLSNGFKLRNNDTAMNRNGQEHLYLAIAEIPFKHSNGR